jgi:hypothetical protein
MINKKLEVVITVGGKSYITEDTVQWPQTINEATELLGPGEALDYLLAGYGNSQRGRIRTQWLAENQPAAAPRKAQAEHVPLKRGVIAQESGERARPRRVAANR